MNDETNGRGLCLLARVTHTGGRQDLNPGITSWYINGERATPLGAYFLPDEGIPEGTSKVLCLFMDFPEGAEEISTLQLYCVLNSYWPNETMAEIVLDQPLKINQTYTIPGKELTIIPATF